MFRLVLLISFLFCPSGFGVEIVRCKVAATSDFATKLNSVVSTKHQSLLEIPHVYFRATHFFEFYETHISSLKHKSSQEVLELFKKQFPSMIVYRAMALTQKDFNSVLQEGFKSSLEEGLIPQVYIGSHETNKNTEVDNLITQIINQIKGRPSNVVSVSLHAEVAKKVGITFKSKKRSVFLFKLLLNSFYVFKYSEIQSKLPIGLNLLKLDSMNFDGFRVSKEKLDQVELFYTQPVRAEEILNYRRL